MKTALNKQVSLFILAILLTISIGKAQSKTDPEVEKLKKELAVANERATLAEASAKQSEIKAQQFQRSAEENAAAARKAEAAASRGRYIAQAKMMAIKSAELKDDPTQEGLVAQLAYKFNTKYGGSPFDFDIYNGLYNALTVLEDPSTKNLTGHGPNVVKALISNERTGEIFSADDKSKILRWKLNGAEWKSDLIADVREDYKLTAMDVSPDGNWLVCGGLSVPGTPKSYLELYDLKNIGKGPKKVQGFTEVKNLIYSFREAGAYVLEQNGNLILYTDFNSVKVVVTPKEKISAIALSHDGHWLAGAGASGTLYRWDLTNNFAEKASYQNTRSLTAVTFSPDNRQMIFGDQDGVLRIIVADSDLPPRKLTGHVASIGQIVFNNAGNFFATTSNDQSARIWNWGNLAQQPIVLREANQQGPALGIAFTRDDQQLMTFAYKSTGIHPWTTSSSGMSELICKHLNRNMTKEEWINFVGSDLPYEVVCESFSK